MIDSHCHLLHTFTPDALPEAVDSLPASLIRLIDISTTEAEYLKIRSLKLPPRVRFAYGLYPDQAAGFNEDTRRRFAELIDAYPPVGIGETGMDYHWDYGAPEVQEKLFRWQIEFASERGLPLIVHSRDAFADTYRVLHGMRPSTPVILHCFGYGRPEAEKFLELGYTLSFAGNLTYRNASALHEAAKIVPLDRILFETDSPYLTPLPHRGKPNSPAYVEHVYRYFAELRGIDLGELESRVEQNFEALFGAM